MKSLSTTIISGLKRCNFNSAYGALANPYFCFYNTDNAEAITYTGQLIIRTAEIEMNKFLNNLFKTNEDYVVASDTDSLYLNLGAYVKTLNIKDKKEIVDALDIFSEDVLLPKFKKIFDSLCKRMNAYKSALHMKRENIVEKGLWRAKKNYALMVWDNEYVRYDEPKIKIVGLESVKSTTPAVCRGKIEEFIKIMFTEDKDRLYQFIDEFKKEFIQFPAEVIGKPTSVKDLNSKVSQQTIYEKGSAIHVKASIFHNNFLMEKKLTNRYPLIQNGDKIRFVFLKKFNPFGAECIAAPDGNFPKEMNIEKYIDREEQFFKTFLHPAQTLLEAAGYEKELISTLEGFFE